MIGSKQKAQAVLFYEFSLKDYVPQITRYGQTN